MMMCHIACHCCIFLEGLHSTHSICSLSKQLAQAAGTTPDRLLWTRTLQEHSLSELASEARRTKQKTQAYSCTMLAKEPALQVGRPPEMLV